MSVRPKVSSTGKSCVCVCEGGGGAGRQSRQTGPTRPPPHLPLPHTVMQSYSTCLPQGQGGRPPPAAAEATAHTPDPPHSRTDRQADRPIDRQPDRDTYMFTHRQMHMHVHTHTHIHSLSLPVAHASPLLPPPLGQVWTYHTRSALVVCVVDKGRPITDAVKVSSGACNSSGGGGCRRM